MIRYHFTVASLMRWVLSSVVLAVSGCAWVQVGGGPIATSSASQQPSLALCVEPTVAWIETVQPGAIGLLNVSRFSGSAWSAVGGALNQSSTESAAEPSLDCVDGQPVVAWTEGTGAARNVYVKRWDGTAWAAVGAAVALNQNAASTASRPVLRVNSALPTTDPLRPTIGQLPQYSALAWIEGGQAKAKLWNGAGWQFYIGGSGPGPNGVTELALTLDQASADLFHPVIALNVPSTLGRRAVTASTNRGGWREIGATPSPLIPNGTALRLGGIGVGEDRSGRLPVAAWFTGSTSATLESTRLASTDFTDAQLGPNPPTVPTWSTYALSYPANDLKSASFDPREIRISCGADRVPTFAIAISDSSGFQVLRGQCNNAPFGWGRVVPPNSGVSLEALSLRMASENEPVVAGVQLVGGQFQLSVWRYVP